MSEAVASQTDIGSVDFTLARFSSASAGNTLKNKGPHLRALFGVACKCRFGTVLEALRMRRSFAGAGRSDRGHASAPSPLEPADGYFRPEADMPPHSAMVYV